jgi:putative endonuclease
MSNDLRHKLGATGEKLAAEHLERRGLTILARNVRSRGGELDIVAADARTVVFCEVKTRRASRTVDPFEGLRRDQRQRIRTTALGWLCETATPSQRRSDLRFDAIGVVVDGQDRLVSLEHLEGCF